jgi:hypothetical protein
LASVATALMIVLGPKVTRGLVELARLANVVKRYG